MPPHARARGVPFVPAKPFDSPHVTSFSLLLWRNERPKVAKGEGKHQRHQRDSPQMTVATRIYAR